MRRDSLVELTALMGSIQESLNMVSNLSFFDKQKQRLDRFKKGIISYATQKEDEMIVADKTFVGTPSELRCLLLIYRHFSKEESFLDRFIEKVLLRQFNHHLRQAEASGSKSIGDKFSTSHVHSALTTFIKEARASILDELFSPVFQCHQPPHFLCISSISLS